jgi:hypothetical protein
LQKNNIRVLQLEIMIIIKNFTEKQHSRAATRNHDNNLNFYRKTASACCSRLKASRAEKQLCEPAAKA